MSISSLPALESQLEACLIELETLHGTRPILPSALARADVGRRIDELYELMVELQQAIDASPAETLQDAAVKLRRLGAYVEGPMPMRLLAGALSAVEKMVMESP